MPTHYQLDDEEREVIRLYRIWRKVNLGEQFWIDGSLPEVFSVYAEPSYSYKSDTAHKPTETN